MTHSTRTPEEFQHITHLLEIRDLSVDFPHPDGHFQAVKSLSLRIAPGEVLALVGESGSGKSVTAAAILGLLPAGKTQCRGEITFRGIPLLNQPDSVLNQVRGHGIATIFQNSLSVLDPSFTIGSQLTENLRRLAPKTSAKQREQQAVEWLEKVGISAAERVLASYPHELSGGMRQRVMIALAIMCQPALLIADEPTTALDSTIQQQILLLLKQLSQSLNMAVLVITHDFGVVSYLSQRVAVMQHRGADPPPAARLYPDVDWRGTGISAQATPAVSGAAGGRAGARGGEYRQTFYPAHRRRMVCQENAF